MNFTDFTVKELLKSVSDEEKYLVHTEPNREGGLGLSLWAELSRALSAPQVWNLLIADETYPELSEFVYTNSDVRGFNILPVKNFADWRFTPYFDNESQYFFCYQDDLEYSGRTVYLGNFSVFARKSYTAPEIHHHLRKIMLLDFRLCKHNFTHYSKRPLLTQITLTAPYLSSAVISLKEIRNLAIKNISEGRYLKSVTEDCRDFTVCTLPESQPERCRFFLGEPWCETEGKEFE